MGGPCDEPPRHDAGALSYALGVEQRLVGEGRAIGHA